MATWIITHKTPARHLEAEIDAKSAYEAEQKLLERHPELKDQPIQISRRR